MKKIIWLEFVIIVLSILMLPSSSNAQTIDESKVLTREKFEFPESIIDDKVRDDYDFFGLATYYNNIAYYAVLPDGIIELKQGITVELTEQQWLAAVGRFRALLIHDQNGVIESENLFYQLEGISNLGPAGMYAAIVDKSELAKFKLELDRLRYIQLWVPLAWMAKLIESVLVWMQSNIVNSWGWVLVVFGGLLRLVLTPVDILTTKLQIKTRKLEAKLEPVLSKIKENYDGEEAHQRLMQVHKIAGVSPFYALKPLIGSFIQIPILVAVFNALGEMSQFDGQAFLWVKNLAYPDAVITFSTEVPMLGNTLNVLPILMTIVTIFSTLAFKASHATTGQQNSQKRNMLLMAVVFLLLFYPFPAVMVLYWATANIFQTAQQHLIRKYI